MDQSPRLSIGQCAALATLLEASAPKPGNVHRGADFGDLTFYDFQACAVAVAPVMEAAAAGARLGPTVLAAVQATRSLIATNANLGTILLVAPMAMSERGSPLVSGVSRVLASLDSEDARLVYEAIRLATPGGMGKVDKADVAGPPPACLIAAMRLAEDRDAVARQYTRDFEDVFTLVLPALLEGIEQGWTIADSIVRTQLAVLARIPDSLIARKCGWETARQASTRAAAALASGRPGDETYHEALADFDFWLRSDGHRRNPGTTADLIAAGLFAALRDGQLGRVS